MTNYNAKFNQDIYTIDKKIEEVFINTEVQEQIIKNNPTLRYLNEQCHLFICSVLTSKNEGFITFKAYLVMKDETLRSLIKRDLETYNRYHDKHRWTESTGGSKSVKISYSKALGYLTVVDYGNHIDCLLEDHREFMKKLINKKEEANK